MQIQVSTTIDRPIAEVWRWYAEEHVRNHPRWDPDMELQQISEGPIGLGTKIRRRNVRFGAPVDGEMEVVEWDPERAIGMLIHDANMQMRGRTTFREEGPDTTVLTIVTDIPDLDESKAGVVSSRMQRTIENVKSLVESDP
jgi:uncharacterized protein YndB with AHSA1/START domain